MSAAPRVTHVIYSGLGGHGAVLFSLLDGGFMRQARHRVLFAGVEEPRSEYIEKCEQACIDWGYQHKSPGKHLLYIHQLHSQLLHGKPDLLFLHGCSAIPALALSIIYRHSQAPFVILRETQANHLKSRHDWFSLLLAYRLADRIVHLTPEAAIGAHKRLGLFVRKAKVSVIPNGLDANYFSPLPRLFNQSFRLHLGMQSRLQPNKDHATLLAAFAEIRKRYAERDPMLHIAGDGATFTDIKQMAESLGLGSSVVMHGLLDQEKLREFLRHLDIYIHCTHGETMSNSIMQALACGIPVVASDIAGVSSMVTPEVGLLHMPGNALDLANKIESLINDPQVLEHMQRQAREYALRNFGINRVVEAYNAILPERMREIATF